MENAIMKKQRLIKNITDQIKEAQMKLGFVRESIRLYFPWDSFMVLLGETLEEEGSGIHSEDKLFPNDGNCSETERKKQKRRILNELNGSAGFGTGGLGQVSFRESRGRVEVTISPEGAEYVHREISDPPFLKAVIELFGTSHNPSVDDVCACFAEFSPDYVCCKIQDNDFDYALYFQDEEIEGHERRTLEAQGARPVGQLVGEVRARPVQHGHKVVGNYFNAAFGQIADRLFVILDIALEIARAGLDMLVDGDALHDRPAKARVGDRLSAFFDLPDGPHLAVGNVMEGGHDVGGPGLTDVLKAYGVVRTVPAPGLFAKIHGCIVFRFSNFSHTVLSPLQARMRRFKTASRGDAGILREQANKRCSPLFACSRVRFFSRPKRRNCRERSRPDAGAVKRSPG